MEKRGKPQQKTDRSKGPTNRPTISAVLDDGTLVEMLYRPDEHKTVFCLAKDGDVVREASRVEARGALLVPYSPDNNLLAHDVVLLPSGLEEYGTDADLIEEIRSFIHTYVDVSPLFEEVASYYVLLTWVHDAFDELPYLRVRGDTGSGKTRCLMSVGALCYKPIFASGASTVSPIFRILDSVQGTLIVDEADFRFSDERSEIIKILNNGNARGFPVLRTESVNGKEFDPRAYTVFGPKIIASRRHFQDRALETRCITEETGRQRLRDDIPLNLDAEWKERARTIRNKLLAYRVRNHGRTKLDPTTADRSIEPRLAQLFGPLLSVVDDADIRDSLAVLAKAYHDELVIDRGMDTEAQVLEVIRDLLARSDSGVIAVKEITQEFSTRYEFDYERRITPKWIGGIVRRNLQLRTHKSNGVFVLSAAQDAKLDRLYAQHGLAVEMGSDDAGQAEVCLS